MTDLDALNSNKRLLVNMPPRHKKEYYEGLYLELAKHYGADVTEHPDIKGVWLINYTGGYEENVGTS